MGLAQPDRVVTLRQLPQAALGPPNAEDTHYVRVRVANLLNKVEDNGSIPPPLLTWAGIEYRFRP
jgi:DNA-binding response OmpR family regulator